MIAESQADAKIVPDDIFSLLHRPWIPVLRASGTRAWMRPAEITDGLDDDPIVAVAWGRADFDAATREFLIGLLATACRAEARDRWRAWFNTPPAAETLDASFAPLRPAFVLDGPGPRFEQDLEDLAGERIPVSQLLIEAPGANTLKKNLDHFVRRGRIEVLSRAGAAVALYTLQTYAPSGGAGHRTSMRGGGPLTTLLAPGPTDDKRPVPLWRTLWLNVPRPEGEADDPMPQFDLARVFPWLAPTRVSDKGVVTTPEDVDPLQAYWGLPRRIRLDFEPNRDGLPCDLTGIVDSVIVRTYRTRPYGTSYTAWLHPLSPSYKQKKTDPVWLPVHGQPGRIGYRHWVGLVVADSETGLRQPAECVQEAERRLADRRVPEAVRLGARLLAAGYDMDNMKARDFIESEMPIHVLPQERDNWKNSPFEHYSLAVQALVAGAREAASILRLNVREALFGKEAPSDGGALALARDRFWDGTEREFESVLRPLADDLENAAEEPRALLASEAARRAWLEMLQSAAERLFDDLVPQTDFDALDLDALERRITARRSLRGTLRGYGKLGAQLFQALDLAPPEPAKSRKKVPV